LFVLIPDLAFLSLHKEKVYSQGNLFVRAETEEGEIAIIWRKRYIIY